jgi:hypothetical protein
MAWAFSRLGFLVLGFDVASSLLVHGGLRRMAWAFFWVGVFGMGWVLGRMGGLMR